MKVQGLVCLVDRTHYIVPRSTLTDELADECWLVEVDDTKSKIASLSVNLARVYC